MRKASIGGRIAAYFHTVESGSTYFGNIIGPAASRILINIIAAEAGKIFIERGSHQRVINPGRSGDGREAGPVGANLCL